jgi:hypothetical protein
VQREDTKTLQAGAVIIFSAIMVIFLGSLWEQRERVLKGVTWPPVEASPSPSPSPRHVCETGVIDCRPLPDYYPTEGEVTISATGGITFRPPPIPETYASSMPDLPSQAHVRTATKLVQAIWDGDQRVDTMVEVCWAWYRLPEREKKSSEIADLGRWCQNHLHPWDWKAVVIDGRK